MHRNSLPPRGPDKLGDELSILVVDDCADLVECLSIDLSIRGFTVATAYNGEDCLTKLARKWYHFIILDVMMPGETLFLPFFGRLPLFADATLSFIARRLYVRVNGKATSLEELDKNIVSSILTNPDNSVVTLPTISQMLTAFHRSGIEDRFGKLYIHFDGFTVCELIKSTPALKHFPHVFIFTAGTGDSRRDKQKAFYSGASGFFLKSEYDPQLLTALQKVLGKEHMLWTEQEAEPEKIRIQGFSSG